MRRILFLGMGMLMVMGMLTPITIAAQRVPLEKPIKAVRMVVLDLGSDSMTLAIYSWAGHCWAVTSKGSVSLTDDALCKGE